MSNLSSPLQSLIDSAATRPATGQIKEYRQRIEVQPSSKESILILDISGSMGKRLASGRRKIEILKSAIAPLSGYRILAFSSDANWVTSPDFLEPDGSTALHLAITVASKLSPKQTLIVSDGEPDSESQALSAAKKLSGTISTLYIGSDQDTDAIDFMRRLARMGCGTAHVQDLNLGELALRQSVQRLLPGW